MSALIMGARQANTDRAGQTTSIEQRIADTPQVVYPTVQDTFHDLSSLFSGGTHPETPVALESVSTELVKGSDSIVGRLGGLKARAGSFVQPGPAGGAHALMEIVHGRR